MFDIKEENVSAGGKFLISRKVKYFITVATSYLVKNVW